VAGERVKVLVTGGAGYIGSTVAAELKAAGHSVIVLDNLSHGYRQAVPARVEFVSGDLSDGTAVRELLKRNSIEAVLHFAASIEAGESMKVPERYFRNNTANTLTLLESMIETGVSKLVFSSTAALYGDPERTPIEETATLKPTNAYGESKLLVEHMLTWFNRIHGLKYASLRYFNAAGATEERGESHVPETHLIPLILQVASGQRDAISIFGTDYATPDGTCVRDYIHVLDLADAHLLALGALSEQSRLIYNLGNGKGFSVRQVIDVAREVTGHPIPVIEGARRPGDPAVLVASSEKIKAELKWSPKHTDLKHIISSAWRWHQRFPKGYAHPDVTHA
jgi:UDP-glucose 4-epimerase